MTEGSEVWAEEPIPVAPKRKRRTREEIAADERAEGKAQLALGIGGENGQPAYRRDRVKIILEENENIPRGGQYFGINGAGFLLQPGVEANVPRGILDILNNAVEGMPVVDPVHGQVVGYRKKLRYPYRLVEAA